MSARQRLNVDAPKHWSTDTYAVSERFGLGLMLLATVYVAGFFTGLRLLGATDGLAVFFAMLLAWVAIVQAWWGKWGRPRAASYTAGAVYFVAFSIWFGLVDGDGNGGFGWVATFVLFGLPSAAMGAVCGYVAGAIVASLFLVYDYLSESFGATRKEREALERAIDSAPRESPWDE